MEILKPLLITLGAALIGGWILGGLVGKLIVSAKYGSSRTGLKWQLIFTGLGLLAAVLILLAVFHKPKEEVPPEETPPGEVVVLPEEGGIHDDDMGEPETPANPGDEEEQTGPVEEGMDNAALPAEEDIPVVG